MKTVYENVFTLYYTCFRHILQAWVLFVSQWNKWSFWTFKIGLGKSSSFEINMNESSNYKVQNLSNIYLKTSSGHYILCLTMNFEIVFWTSKCLKWASKVVLSCTMNCIYYHDFTNNFIDVIVFKSSQV